MYIKKCYIIYWLSVGQCIYACVYFIAVKSEFAKTVVLLLSKSFYIGIRINSQLKFTPQIIKRMKTVLVPVCSCMLLDFCYWLRVAQQNIDPFVLMCYANTVSRKIFIKLEMGSLLSLFLSCSLSAQLTSATSSSRWSGIALAASSTLKKNILCSALGYLGTWVSFISLPLKRVCLNSINALWDIMFDSFSRHQSL